MYQKSKNSVNSKSDADKIFLPCPAKQTIDLFKSKYSVEILEQILIGNTHYGALLRSITTINPRILSSTLRHFEKEGILCREVFPTSPPQVEYTLSQKGLALKPIFKLLNEWHTEYYES